MGSVREKLECLAQTKEILKYKLIDKGATINDDTRFRDYVGAIDEITNITGIKPIEGIVIAKSGGEITTGIAEWTPFNRWNFWQEDDDEEKLSSTLTAKPTAKCYLLACVTHRNANITISGDGWTKITSQIGYAETNAQHLTVFGKYVNAGSHEVTTTLETSARMSLKLIALYKSTGVSVVDNKIIAEYPYNPPATTGKRRLYLAQNKYAFDTDTWFKYTADGLDLQIASEFRNHAYYDYQPGLGITPTFEITASDYRTNTDGFITLDIEGE